MTRFPASEHERTVLTIRAAADADAMAPLIRDYQQLYPDVTVIYHEYVTADLFGEVAAACAAGRAARDYPADVVISSSVDHLIKLANDGCARAHRSFETARQPDWAAWRDEVFGFTTEPAVIAYRPDLVPPEDLPHSRVALVDLLRRKPEAYAGRIGSYDITLSGIGYLFAAYDARAAATYGRLVEAFGRADLRVRCCTGDLIADLEAGRIAIGYNLLGSYVYRAMRRGAGSASSCRGTTPWCSAAPSWCRSPPGRWATPSRSWTTCCRPAARRSRARRRSSSTAPARCRRGRGSAEPRHRRHPAADHRRAGAARGAGPGQARPLPRRVAPVDRRGGAPRRAATGGAVTLPAPPRIAPLRARAESA